MTDERIDALIRRLDVAYDPDPAYIRQTLATLRPRAQAARVNDAGRLGRVARDVRLVLRDAAPSRSPRRAAILLVALVALAMVGLVIAGSLRRVPAFPSGPLIFSYAGELQALDGATGTPRP